MSDEEQRAEAQEHWTFPEWHNIIPPVVFGVVGPLVTVLVLGSVWYYFSPKFTDVGYKPEQPVPYSHKLHAGDLGIDCRYCHVGAERGPHAGVPPTQVCMNCHANVKPDSPKLLPVRESWATGKPIEWVRVHKTPDYAYFDHSAHLGAGVGCETCHGRVDQMVTVEQKQSLSMAWCLECHRNPEHHLRPISEVASMGYKASKPQLEVGTALAAQKKINPPKHCSGCHR